MLLGFLPALAVLCSASTSQDSSSSRPRASLELEAKVDALFDKYGSTTPGAVAAVIRAGEIVYCHAYGMADLERNVPLTASSVFNIASMSKQFTAMGIALLVVRGKLQLADDVHQYLPELPEYGRPIRVGHLLHHTSGLKDYGQILQRGDFTTLDCMTRDRVLPLVFRQRTLNFLPGDEFDYSDTNYVLLALIVERISGGTFAEFARKEIFEPLGMAETRVCDDVGRIVPGRALGYAKSGNGWRLGDSYSEVGGAGDVFTTAGDLAKWDRNFYDMKVGGQEAHDILLRTEPLNDGFPNNYAGGLKILEVRGLVAIEHSGGEVGYDVDMIRFPDQRLTVAVLTNDRDDSQPKTFAQRIADLYLPVRGDPPESPKPEPSAEPYKLDPNTLQPFAGLYWDGRTDAVRRLVVSKGGLFNAKLPDLKFAPMDPVGPNHFTRGVVDYTLTQDPVTLSRGLPGTKPVTFRRVEPAALDPHDLEACAGTYYCDDADVTYGVFVDHGTLVLRRRGRADERLVPAFKDAYFGDPGLLVFRHAEDRVVLDVMGERLRKLEFARR